MLNDDLFHTLNCQKNKKVHLALIHRERLLSFNKFLKMKNI